jgi:hypothetical protein
MLGINQGTLIRQCAFAGRQAGAPPLRPRMFLLHPRNAADPDAGPLA